MTNKPRTEYCVSKMSCFVQYINLGINRAFNQSWVGRLSALSLLFLLVQPIQAQNAAPPANALPQKVDILVLGDSLSAEFGLPRGSGWVSLLEAKRRSSSEANQNPIINASISGETTSGGRSRLSVLWNKYTPKILVLELGANDALRGLPLSAAQANLDAMTKQALEHGTKVLIVGNLVPSNYGEEFNKELSKMYASVAQKNHVALVPFMLKGVADAANAKELFQADQIHPIAAAHPTILANILPSILKLENTNLSK